MPHSRVEFCVLLLAALLPAGVVAQNESGEKGEPTVISSVRLVHDRGDAAVEIVSTRPVVPVIQSLDSPPRVVIDLPNARSGMQEKRISVLQENILTVKIEQTPKRSSSVRIVVSLLVPYGYAWDVAGNRLMVRLKPPEDPYAASKKASSQQPQVVALAASAEAAVLPTTTGIGQVVLAGRRFAAGASVTAGSETALLQLARGGEIQVCPGTTLSVTPSKSTKDLMLGLSTGAIETHYGLDATADTVLTPDFRIAFNGPGQFNFAISTDSKGDTCVRGLRGNSSTAMVSELIGDRSYQVKPSEQAVFHSGRIDKVDTDVPLECGCPPPPPPVLRADASTKVVPDPESSHITLAQGGVSAPASTKPEDRPGASGGEEPASRQTLSNGPEIQRLPRLDPNEAHVQVEAPLVFQARTILSANPVPAQEAAALPVVEPSRVITLQASALPPPVAPAEKNAQHRGFLGKIRGFFSAIFR